MSRYFPHSDYAEDQPFFKTLLTAHVLYRGFQSGSMLGIVAGTTRSLLLLRGSTLAAIGPLVRATIERSAGVGGVMGTGLLAVSLTARMWGREEIEWRDRSWRLLENQGQMEVDDWSLAGAVLGAVAVTMSTRRGELRRWRRVVGGAGIGSMAGVMGYMAWRYGVRGGKR
ncbi:hypothetical protein MMC24_004113 [Lignoscripta atroalba]|nr:hypothetical protein [Lignoscripta atroalba]